jgi:hypothetical protein
MVALIGAGCSNGSADTGNTTAHATAMQFAKCMRENGVSAFPDPDASGGLTIDGIANGSSVDPSAAAFKKAIGACRDLEPGGFMGHKRSAQEQQHGLEFAQFRRDNGVKDFPDPTNDGPLMAVRPERYWGLIARHCLSRHRPPPMVDGLAP